MKRAAGERERDRGRPLGLDGHIRFRKWARALLGAIEGVGLPSAPDLVLSLLSAVVASRVRSGPEDGAALWKQVSGIRDLARLTARADPALARDIEKLGSSRARPTLDPVLVSVWREFAESDLAGHDGDLLGLAYEAVLSAEDALSGERLRKLGGVFYTPTEIVDYILDRTIGRRPEGRPTILDPACGSGAFLLGAYRRLREARGAPSLGDRTGLLESSVFGVDIDPRAARLSRINLALAARGTAGGRGLDRVLSQQVVVGSALDEVREGRRIASAIDRSFGRVLRRGGFDYVIGNPPYVRNKDLDPRRKRLWAEVYRSARGQYDLMVLFLEKGIEVLRAGGRLGFLVSSKFMTASYGRALREQILETCQIEEIVDLSRAHIFPEAAIYPAVLVLRKNDRAARPRGTVVLRDGVTDLRKVTGGVPLPQALFLGRPGRVLTTSISRAGARVLSGVERVSVPLGDLARLSCGLAHRGMGRSLLTREEAEGRGDGGSVHPFIRVENIAPYRIRWTGRWVNLEGGRYSAERLRDFRRRKIVIPGVRRTLQAAYDTRGYALGRVYYLVDGRIDPRVLLAILNSSVLDGYYRTVFGAVRMAGGFLRFNGPYLRALPIARVDPADPRVQRMMSLVGRRLGLNRKRRSEAVSDEIQALEQRIDALVLDLYGLSQRQRAAISGSGKPG